MMSYEIPFLRKSENGIGDSWILIIMRNYYFFSIMLIDIYVNWLLALFFQPWKKEQITLLWLIYKYSYFNIYFLFAVLVLEIGIVKSSCCCCCCFFWKCTLYDSFNRVVVISWDFSIYNPLLKQIVLQVRIPSQCDSFSCSINTCKQNTNVTLPVSLHTHSIWPDPSWYIYYWSI